MRATFRLGWHVAVALSLLSTATRPASAQQVATGRTAATVDYVSADGLYLTVGTDQGAARGDTIAVFEDEASADSSARLVLTSVTRRRAVASVIEGRRPFQAGDVVFLRLPRPAASTVIVDANPEAQADVVPTRSTGADSGPHVSGRVALDFEARETLTAWDGVLFGETRRRFATPTTRVSFVATRLPGDITLRANVRAAYRYDELAGGPPPVSVRAYEVAAIKSFERVPLEIMVGRFGNPYESYSAYWDGALLRVGGSSGFGIGVAGGFEPELYNEGFSSARPKLTAFADFVARGSTWRYQTDASFHVTWPTGGPDRRFVGWSQRLSTDRFTLSQRLRVDEGPRGGSWSPTELRLRGSLDIAGPLRVRSAFRTARSGFVYSFEPGGSSLSPVRREVSVGVELSGELGSLSVDGGRTDRDGRSAGVSIYGGGLLRLGSASVMVSGRRWNLDQAVSWSVAPSLSLQASSWEARVGYRLYRNDVNQLAMVSQSAEGQLGLSLTPVTRLTLRGERQWGSNLSGTRVRLGLWRSF